MKEFTFGVLAYNQEEYVLETLESILHQVIINPDYIFNLYITDDCSEDNTISNIDNWLKKNSSKFNKIIFKKNESNLGVSINYNYILEHIHSENFKIIAADDLISKDNCVKMCENLHDMHIISGALMILCNNIISFDVRRIKELIYNSNHCKDNSYNLKYLRRGCFFHTPSTIYNKNTYIHGECKKFNSQFKLFEDDPTWYAMLKNIANIKVEFVPKVVVLYRIHEHSISNSEICNIDFINELNKLRQIYLSESKGIEKIYLKSLIKNSIHPSLFPAHKVINRLRLIWITFLCHTRYRRVYFETLKYLYDEVKQQQIFYDSICDTVSKQ